MIIFFREIVKLAGVNSMNAAQTHDYARMISRGVGANLVFQCSVEPQGQ
jgi:hypothetical protein